MRSRRYSQAAGLDQGKRPGMPDHAGHGGLPYPASDQLSPAGECRQQVVDLFFTKFRSKLDPTIFWGWLCLSATNVAPAGEIKDLTAFYPTPWGQRTKQILSQSVPELVAEVLDEHPDMARAQQVARAEQEGWLIG